ncbi:MAG: hypothetical protein FWF83_05845 [Clostridiales bacterium]|nr:hypothetical protein [Clostridiales bacterium]
MDDKKHSVTQDRSGIEASIEDRVEQIMGESQERRSLMAASRKKGFDFWQYYGLTVALLIIAIGGGLGYLWQNLALYEKSMPEQVLEVFRYPLIQGGLPRLMVFEAAKPAKYEASQDRDSYIRALLASGEMTYQRAPAESGGGREVYVFKAGGLTLASVTLEKREAGRFGQWEAVKDEVRMPIYGDLRVSAPHGAEVFVNGVSAFGEDKLEAASPYEELKRLPQDLVEAPYQEEYRITGLYREPEVTAIGVMGNPLEALWLDEGEGPSVRFVPYAPEEEYATYEKMALEDKRLYNLYLSNDMEFGALGRRMIRGTEIYRNMQLMETVFYTNHVANETTNERVHNVKLYSPDCLTVDIDYTYTITRANGMTYPFDTVVTFSYYQIEGQWLICDIALQQE